MNALINQIKSRVIFDYSFENPKDITDYSDRVYTKEIEIKSPQGVQNVTAKIWTKAFERAFSENTNVYVPDIGEVIYLDDSIVLSTGNKLKVEKTQRIAMIPHAAVTLVRNKNLISGADKFLHLNNPDCGIVIDGGIWDSLEYTKEFTRASQNGNFKLWSSKEDHIPGAWAIMIFSNVRDIIIKNATFENGQSYAIQISNCEGMDIQDLQFNNYHKDGVHINGTVKYGYVANLTGKDMGDDMVAMNAWDWNTSAMSFGSIEKLFVENVFSSHNEFRLLPGRKSYSDGTFADCDIKDCVIKNVEGVYTFKLYGQPNCHDTSDCSETLGVIKNVHFEDIRFPEISPEGFGGLPVEGLFEVCADVSDVWLNNISIESPYSDFEKYGVSVIKVGPLSATIKYNPDDISTWIEVFYPDNICTMKDTHIGKISFADYTVTKDDINMVAKATRQTPNPDYPNTTPKGGTGYGIIENVIFE